MQKDSDNDNEPKTYCPSCGRYILTQNYLLHQGRCQRMSQLRLSRASSTNQKQQQPKFPEKKESSRKQEEPSSKYSFSKNIPKQIIRPSMQKKRSQQKIPCYFCGYMQSLEQLDTHPNVCQHWEVECQFCKSKYPKSLMNDHKAICQKNPQNIQRNQRNEMRRQQRNQMRRNDRPEQYYQNSQDEEGFMPMFFQRRNRNLYRPSPLMDIFNEPFFGGGFMNRQPQPRMQQQQMGPSFHFVQFSSNNNQGQPRIIIRSNSSNPATFIQLIEMLARRANPNQNPGLNEQQLSRLNRIKYKKKGQQPDLCTICYCQFQQNEQVIQLSCKHIFHQECIFEWLKRVSTCPVCKKKMKQGPQSQQIEEQNYSQNQPRRPGFMQQLFRF